jgi:hypothetical protein
VSTYKAAPTGEVIMSIWMKWFSVFCVLNILDAVTTALIMVDAGISAEVNPVIHYLLSVYGLPALFLLKTAGLMGIYACRRWVSVTVLKIVTYIFIVVVANNMVWL